MIRYGYSLVITGRWTTWLVLKGASTENYHEENERDVDGGEGLVCGKKLTMPL